MTALRDLFAAMGDRDTASRGQSIAIGLLLLVLLFAAAAVPS